MTKINANMHAFPDSTNVLLRDFPYRLSYLSYIAKRTEVEKALSDLDATIDECQEAVQSIKDNLRILIQQEDFEEATVLKKQRDTREAFLTGLETQRLKWEESLNVAYNVVNSTYTPDSWGDSIKVTRVSIFDPASGNEVQVTYLDSSDTVSFSFPDVSFDAEAYHLYSFAFDKGLLIKQTCVSVDFEQGTIDI